MPYEILQNLTNNTNLTQTIQNATNNLQLTSIKQYFFPETITAFLRQPILTTGLLYFDYWSVIHIIIGYLLGKIILNFSQEKTNYYIIGITTLILFEIFEYILRAQGIITTETFKDIFTDIITGTIGLMAADFGIWLILIIIALIFLFKNKI